MSNYFVNILDKNKVISGFLPDKWQSGYEKCCLNSENYIKTELVKTYKYQRVVIKQYNVKCSKCNHEIIANLLYCNKTLNWNDWKYFNTNLDWNNWTIIIHR